MITKLMPRRIPDYPDAFSIWNAVSSFGSLISVVATVLFIYIIYNIFFLKSLFRCVICEEVLMRVKNE